LGPRYILYPSQYPPVNAMRIVSGNSKIKGGASRRNSSSPSPPLLDLVVHLLPLGLLLRRAAQVAAHPLERIAAHHQAGPDERQAVADQAVLAGLLLLGAEHANDVVLALGALPQREEDDRPAALVQLAGGLLHDGEVRLEGGQRGVAQGVGALDVRRHVLVGPGEVGEQRLAQALVAGGGEVEGFRAVGVGLEGADGVGDDGEGDEML
jgi:hypothetical protein